MPGGRWDGRRTGRDGAGATCPMVNGQPAENRRRPTAILALAPMLPLLAAALGMVGCAGSSGRADAGAGGGSGGAGLRAGAAGVGSGGTGVAGAGGAPSIDAGAAMDAPPDGAADRPGGTGGAAMAGVDGGDARDTDGGDATATPPLPPIAIGPCRWRGVGVTHDLRFSADGSKLIVAGGPYFKVFDATTGAHGAASGWQSGDIAAMTVSPDGRWFGGYSSRTTGTGASVWRVADPGQGRVLSSDPQKGFAFAPDSSLVAIASEEISNQLGATVSVFRLSDLSRVATMTVAQWSSSDILMFSSDGAYLMTGFVTATRSWRTTDWSPGPAGLSFPVGAEAPNELHNDAFSAARDLDAGFELSSADSLSLTLIGNATRAVKAPPAVLFSAVAVSHDGALVAAGAQDGRVLVYQPSDDFLLQLDDTPPAPRTFTHAAGRISVVAFSPDDRQLAAVGADGTLDMWRLSDGARIWSAAGVGGESDLYNAFLIAASADSGTLLVAPGNDNAVLLDATADVVKGRLSGPNAGAQVGDCAASPEATAMVCADSDRAWLLTPGNAAQPIGTSLAGAPRVRGGMALLPGGGGLLELVTPAGNDFGSDADLLAWPLGAGPARVVAHLGSLPNVLVVSGDGKVAAAPTDQFNGMRAWDLPDGTMRGSWLSPDTGIASLIGPMAISRQGEVLAGVGASRNITVARAGEPAARLLLQPGTASRLDTVALSSDGALVAAGTVFAEGASTDPAVFVLRVSDGQPLLGLPGTARRVAFFDDRTLVRGENDGTVTFWCLP